MRSRDIEFVVLLILTMAVAILDLYVLPFHVLRRLNNAYERLEWEREQAKHLNGSSIPTSMAWTTSLWRHWADSGGLRFWQKPVE